MRSAENSLTKMNRAAMRQAKKHSKVAAEEFRICFASNPKTQNVESAEDIRRDYPRDYPEYESPYVHCGWSKKTFCCVLIDGEYRESEYIVIKRMNPPSWMGERLVNGCENQLVREIRTWQDLANKPESDYICPIIRWGYQQGDKVDESDPVVCDTVYIIAMKACFVGDLESACRHADRLNRRNGYSTIDPDIRFHEISAFCDRMGWWDIQNGNDGNCGVIFDFERNMYKAVVIDYAV